jgi:hypothetical protein
MGWRFINRRWCGFGVSGLLLTHLLFLIEVIEDNDIVIAGRPEKSSKSFLAISSSCEVSGKASSSPYERSTTGNP